MSSDAVHAWSAGSPAQRGGSGLNAAVFRMPLHGGAPSSLRVAGTPVDQLSFLENADHHRNALVDRAGQGDGMWNADRPGGALTAVRWARRASVASLALPHGVQRIEAMGQDAVVVGTAGSGTDLHGTRIARAARASVAGT